MRCDYVVDVFFTQLFKVEVELENCFCKARIMPTCSACGRTVYIPNAPFKDGLKEKGHFFLLSNFFSLLLNLKEEHVSDQKMI